MNRAAVLAASASAALFGVSTPAAKALLGVVHPVILAGLFYCGAGIGIALLRALAALGLDAPAARQPPARAPRLWLARQRHRLGRDRRPGVADARTRAHPGRHRVVAADDRG